MNHVLKILFLVLINFICTQSRANEHVLDLLNEKSVEVLTRYIKEDVEVSFIGGKSLIPIEFSDIPKTTSREVSAAYKENEVKSDMIYKNKIIFLSETVYGINAGVFDSMYITLSDSFSSPQARFRESERQYVSELKRNQKIKIICTGAGMTLGSVMFSECFSMNRVLSIAERKIFSELKSQLKNKRIDTWVAGLVAFSDPKASKVKKEDNQKYFSDYKKSLIDDGFEIIDSNEKIFIDINKI